jgi:hypothetical protein
VKRTFILSKDTYQKSLAYAMSVIDQMLGDSKVVALDVYEIEPTRTIEQNDKLHAMLGDISKQMNWQVDGQSVKLSIEEWKYIFTASLVKHTRVAKGLDGGYVILGTSTRKMSVKAMSDLIELMYAFGAENNIQWSRE